MKQNLILMLLLLVGAVSMTGQEIPDGPKMVVTGNMVNVGTIISPLPIDLRTNSENVGVIDNRAGGHIETSALNVSAGTTLNNEDYLCVGCVPLPCTSVMDIDGNVYPAKMFGNQCWMTKNLRVSRTYTGATFPAAKGAANDSVKIDPGYYTSTANAATTVTWDGSKVVYASGTANTTDNATYQENGVAYALDYDAFANKFGFLYTWTDAQSACPEGWYLPSAADYNTLAVTLGNVRDAGTDEAPTWTTNIAGKAMKANNSAYAGREDATARSWGGFDADDASNSGFDALPAGRVRTDGTTVFNFTNGTYYWTKSASGELGANINLNSSTDEMLSTLNQTAYAFSVRCLRN